MSATTVRVRRAATVICVRRPKLQSAAEHVVTWKEAMGSSPWPPAVGADLDQQARVRALFGEARDRALLPATWEVLMGQNEVVNWLRSTPEKQHLMRYPGEWKYAGGTVDPGETVEVAARRELEEEFDLQLPSAPERVVLRLQSVRQTRVISGVSNIMFNYVAVADENPWLEEMDVPALNARLQAKRMRHAELLSSGKFWSMSEAEKEECSPEVREVRWMSMKDAVMAAFSSMHPELTPHNEFQASEFARVGRSHRDTMFLTMALLLDVASFPSLRTLRRHCEGLDVDAEQARVQWVFDGQSIEEARVAFQELNKAIGHHPLLSSSQGSAESRAELMVERRRADAEADEARARL